ncbi:hypothetical protein AVEN_97216-1 [Araneus ventricosus]|uniref:Transposase Tc1-like domain-containing protein n=1 Tax=Araneus ventricosus TaxID=182803 RepID=A0A4Y2G9V3_ARAVE|nr:hypothetical protein AVEN_97216-1 [Araneus ventricosus]
MNMQIRFALDTHCKVCERHLSLRFDVGYEKKDFLSANIEERLGRNVSTVHDCWQQWSWEGTASRRPASGQPRGTTEREDRRVRRIAVANRTASAAEIRAAVGTTETQRTVTNRLLQGKPRARLPVACIPLTPNHCRLRREWCQARAHWKTEWRSVVFSDESRFCLGTVMAVCWPEGGLQPTCLRSRHTGPTPGVMVWGAILYDSRSTLMVIPRTLTLNLYISLVIQPVVLPFMNSIQGGVFQQDNVRTQTGFVT